MRQESKGLTSLESSSSQSGCEEDDADDNAGHTWEWKEVLEQELEKIEELRWRRAPDGGSSTRFSLAFSGGGMRAAAFQAGVLWRLAKENRLKDVEYFTAVSGGGYITAAFASFCVAAPPPKEGEVREWYLQVVAQTILRMQANAGDFVRDCVKQPWYADTEGAGQLPRICDIPLLLTVVGVTLLVHPLIFVICVLVPFTVFIEAYFGAAMRATVCAPPTEDRLAIFVKFSGLQHMLLVFCGLVLAAGLVTLLRRAPICQLRRVEGKRRREAGCCHLLGHATFHLLKRLAWALLILILFVVGIPSAELFTYSSPEMLKVCSQYIKVQREQGHRCSDVFAAKVWYADAHFANYSSHRVGPFRLPHHTEPPLEVDTEMRKPLMKNALGFFTLVLGFFLVFAVCIMPLIGVQVLVHTVALAGPLVLLAWCLTVVQYRVFGPITQNKNGVFGLYQAELGTCIIRWSLRLALLLLPLYEDLRALLHMYYKRCLKQNFFAKGRDVQMTELGNHPYCPFVVLTGTSNDFQPPDDTDKISELSFSCLHFGGEETGYVRMPSYRTLSKCTAITGAGCLDAISLSMSDALALRFWLEVLNLSWGDYVIFRHIEWVRGLTKALPSSQGILIRAMHRAPSVIIWFGIFLLLNLGWDQLHTRECMVARRTLGLAGWSILIAVCGSFYTFLPVGDVLCMSPLLRQLHQVTRYFYIGNTPPRMLYMTDGGVKDCTSIVQLLWRQRERILLVLAAADPLDELKVLKAAMEVALHLKLASFYDPQDPRRDLEVMFKKFAEKDEMRYLHVGISYCFDSDREGARKSGHLVIFKNRLPPSLAGRVRPPITEEEVMRNEDGLEEAEWATSDDEHEDWAKLLVEDLGPYGCCDCCHTQGLNCGPKFPHGTFTGYLYLSPKWCSSLMRLGFMASAEAVEKVCGEALCSSWEKDICPS